MFQRFFFKLQILNFELFYCAIKAFKIFLIILFCNYYYNFLTFKNSQNPDFLSFKFQIILIVHTFQIPNF